MKLIFASLTLFFLSTILSAQNSVSTLELSEPIPALGRLGGISVDKLGIIYVADFRDKVWKVTPLGKRTLFADGIYGASGNTIDSRGNLIQSNFNGNTLVRIDRNGNSSEITSKNLSGPVGVVEDSLGNIYVCNCTGNTITKIDTMGVSSIFSKHDLYNCPNGITIGPDNDLYVTNYHNDIIMKINSEGTASEFTTVAGGQGIAHIVFSNDNFYVTKNKANTIHRVTPEGKSVLVAGSFSEKGTRDGEALSATFSRPNGIAKDLYGGDLYVNTLDGKWVLNGYADPGVIAIRKIDIKTVTEVFDQALNDKDLESAVAAYQAYIKDSTHTHEDILAMTSTYAWQLMIQRKITEAIQVFALLSETYPERWLPYYNLGRAHTLIGQNEKAIEYFRTSLEKRPNNPLVESKLKVLEGK